MPVNTRRREYRHINSSDSDETRQSDHTSDSDETTNMATPNVIVYNNSLPLPRFSSKTGSIDSFFKSFEDVAKQNNWSHDKCKELLPTTFLSKDRDRIQVCIDKFHLQDLPYADFKKKILQIFRKPSAKIDVGIKLRERIQRKRENVTNYVIDIQALIAKFNYDIEEDATVSLIINGLRPYYLERIGNKSFQTVNELLTELQAIETTRYTVRNRQRKTRAEDRHKKKNHKRSYSSDSLPSSASSSDSHSEISDKEDETWIKVSPNVIHKSKDEPQTAEDVEALQAQMKKLSLQLRQYPQKSKSKMQPRSNQQQTQQQQQFKKQRQNYSRNQQGNYKGKNFDPNFRYNNRNYNNNFREQYRYPRNNFQQNGNYRPNFQQLRYQQQPSYNQNRSFSNPYNQNYNNQYYYNRQNQGYRQAPRFRQPYNQQQKRPYPPQWQNQPRQQQNPQYQSGPRQTRNQVYTTTYQNPNLVSDPINYQQPLNGEILQ